MILLILTSPVVLATRTPELDDGTNALQGINYILTKSDLYSVYDLQDGGATEYVLTAPTKRLSQKCGVADDIFDSIGVNVYIMGR